VLVDGCWISEQKSIQEKGNIVNVGLKSQISKSKHDIKFLEGN